MGMMLEILTLLNLAFDHESENNDLLIEQRRQWWWGGGGEIRVYNSYCYDDHNEYGIDDDSDEHICWTEIVVSVLTHVFLTFLGSYKPSGNGERSLYLKTLLCLRHFESHGCTRAGFLDRQAYRNNNKKMIRLDKMFQNFLHQFDPWYVGKCLLKEFTKVSQKVGYKSFRISFSPKMTI